VNKSTIRRRRSLRPAITRAGGKRHDAGVTLPAHHVEVVRPAKLKPGDHVCLVSPASTPTREGVEGTTRFLEGLGLHVTVGDHALDELGFLAGTDEHRAADFNAALRDPNIKAIIATTGGKGAYRIADRLDFAAARQFPKLLIGFSEITILHLALWGHCGLTGIHGAPFETSWAGAASASSFLSVAFTTDDVTVRRSAQEPTGVLTTTGRASGVLLGGNQDMVATAAGWMLPSLDGAILLLEAVSWVTSTASSLCCTTPGGWTASARSRSASTPTATQVRAIKVTGPCLTYSATASPCSECRSSECRSSAASQSATETTPSPYRWEPQRRSTRTPARCE
jgi:hypothetical protein